MNRILTALNMERSRSDIKHFYEWLGYTWGEHIGEWMDLYGDRRDKQVHRVCVIAPRDHSKSTTLRVKVLHQLLFEKWRGRPFTIWLFSANKDLAMNRLEEIRQDLKRHPELSRMIDEKKGNRFEIRLTNGAWIKATSVGSGIRGEHPAAIALDDVLDTPMSMNDLYHTEMLNNESWDSWRKGAIVNYDEWRNEEDIEAKCLWPSERPLEFLLEQRQAIGELAFAQEYLCKVVDDDSAVFPQTITRKNMDMSMVLQNNCIYEGQYAIGFDPSHGIGQDYSVMVVLRKDEDGNIHIVNVWRKNDFPPEKQIDAVIDYNSRFRKPKFAFESAGFQSLYSTLLQQRGVVLDMKLSKVSNRTLKQGLLTRLRSWFEQGKIIIPYGDDATRRIMNILLDELESHVWKNGNILDKGRHNDTVMALAHAIDLFNLQSRGGMPAAGAAGSMKGWGKTEKGQKSSVVRRNSGKSGKYRTFF